MQIFWFLVIEYKRKECALIDLVPTKKYRGYEATKRVIDLGFVFFVFFFLWWVLLFAWMAVKISSPGPGIFAQERIGKHGRQFVCYKFRTMFLGTKQAGTHEIFKSNVTPIGRVLRKSKIDELPQIWNILKNQMSLVGPRPCLPMQEQLVYERRIRGVLNIKCGITGWAQILGIDMSNPSKLAEIDQVYLNRRSLIFDLRIIVATAVGKAIGDSVKK